jgi:hypothetical protein
MPYIHYNGIGANKNEIHTVDEFLSIMKSDDALKHYYEMSAFGIDMEYKNYTLPSDFLNFTLDEWLDYSGAEYNDGDWDW